MPLVLNDNPRVSLEVLGKTVTHEFKASDQFNADLGRLATDGWKRTKGGNAKRNTKLFLSVYDRNIDRVEGYAVRAGDESEPDDLMTFLTEWKQHIPEDHKIAAVGQLLSKEAIDEDDVED